MSDEVTEVIKVTAPDGSLHTFHPGAGRRGFVYASGRRVYGYITRFEYSTTLGRAVGVFLPRGKYASLVAAPAVETVSV